jgi:hypothetical protein
MDDDLESLEESLNIALDSYLCDMKEGFDDSIVGFNEAWAVMRAVFKRRRQSPSPAPTAATNAATSSS